MPLSLMPPAPVLTFLARVTVELAAPVWEVGETTGLGRRRIIPITGGRVEGPRLTGAILDHGADWQIVTADAVALIETRYLLALDDGALCYLRTRGYRHGPAEVMARVGAGEAVDAGGYYFRLSLVFETASARYGFLNRTVCVGSAMRLGQAVVYDAFTLD